MCRILFLLVMLLSTASMMHARTIIADRTVIGDVDVEDDDLYGEADVKPSAAVIFIAGERHYGVDYEGFPNSKVTVTSQDATMIVDENNKVVSRTDSYTFLLPAESRTFTFIGRNSVGDSPAVTLNYIKEGDVIYVKVNDIAELNVWDKYIVASSLNNIGETVNKAIGWRRQEVGFQAVDVEIDGGVLLNPSADVMKFTLSKEVGGWKWIADNFVGRSKVGLWFSEVSGISLSDKPSTTDVTISNPNVVISSYPDFQILYNKSRNRFSNYKSGYTTVNAYAPVQIYRHTEAMTASNDLNDLTVGDEEIAILGPVKVLNKVGSNVWMEDADGNRFYAKAINEDVVPANVALGSTLSGIVLRVDRAYDLNANEGTKYYEGMILTAPVVAKEKSTVDGIDVSSVDRTYCGNWVRMQGDVTFNTDYTATFRVNGRDYKLQSLREETSKTILSTFPQDIRAMGEDYPMTWGWQSAEIWPEGTYHDVYVASMVAPDAEDNVVLYPYDMAIEKSLTAVEDIDQDAMTVAIDGRTILAPQGSVVYDVSGARVAATNYATGLYFVHLPNGTVCKVLVR